MTQRIQRPIFSPIGDENKGTENGKLEGATNRLLLASQRHLSELVEAQQNLELNEAKLNDFATAASDWFWETDENLAITSVSDRFFELTGKEATGVVGHTLKELSSNQDSLPVEIRNIR